MLNHKKEPLTAPGTASAGRPCSSRAHRMQVQARAGPRADCMCARLTSATAATRAAATAACARASMPSAASSRACISATAGCSACGVLSTAGTGSSDSTGFCACVRSASWGHVRIVMSRRPAGTNVHALISQARRSPCPSVETFLASTVRKRHPVAETDAQGDPLMPGTCARGLPARPASGPPQAQRARLPEPRLCSPAQPPRALPPGACRPCIACALHSHNTAASAHFHLELPGNNVA